jgi:hypothetical protein
MSVTSVRDKLMVGVLLIQGEKSVWPWPTERENGKHSDTRKRN